MPSFGALTAHTHSHIQYIAIAIPTTKTNTIREEKWAHQNKKKKKRVEEKGNKQNIITKKTAIWATIDLHSPHTRVAYHIHHHCALNNDKLNERWKLFLLELFSFYYYVICCYEIYMYIHRIYFERWGMLWTRIRINVSITYRRSTVGCWLATVECAHVLAHCLVVVITHTQIHVNGERERENGNSVCASDCVWERDDCIFDNKQCQRNTETIAIDPEQNCLCRVLWSSRRRSEPDTPPSPVHISTLVRLTQILLLNDTTQPEWWLYNGRYKYTISLVEYRNQAVACQCYVRTSHRCLSHSLILIVVNGNLST